MINYLFKNYKRGLILIALLLCAYEFGRYKVKLQTKPINLQSLLDSIKRYEGWHNSNSYIFYGHKIVGKEVYSQDTCIAEEVLLNDLTYYIHAFNSYKDSIALGLLAYNIGEYRLKGSKYNPKSDILIYMEQNKPRYMIDSVWLLYSNYKGKFNTNLYNRRKFEIKLLQYDK